MDRVEGQPATSANGASSTLTTRPRRREPLVAAAVDATVEAAADAAIDAAVDAVDVAAGAASGAAGSLTASPAEAEPEPGPRGSKMLGGHPAKPLILLSGVTLVDQIDTSILRGVLPLVKEDFGMSDLQGGALGFAFVFVNAIASIPAGWVADRVKRTRLIGWTLLSWSVLSVFSGLARSFTQLFAARASLGFGQAIDDPASSSLLADEYPANVRGKVFSVQQVTTFVGGGLGVGLGGLVGALWGWQWAFVIVGVPGSLLAFAVFRMQEPKRGAADGIEIAEPEPMPFREMVKEARVTLVRDLRMILGIRTMRYILVGVSAMLFTVSGVGYWLTDYHHRYSGMSEEVAAGVAGAILAIAGIIGTIWGGRRADRAHDVSPAARINLVSNGVLTCLFLFTGSLLVPIVPVRLLMQFVGVLAAASAIPGLRASMMDVTPVHARGVSVSAFALVSTVLGTALAPLLVGAISDATGSLVAAFFLVMPPVIVGTLLLRRAKSTIVEDAAAIFTSMAEAAAAAEGGTDGSAAAS